MRNNIYSEGQFAIYSDYLNKIANEEDISKNFHIYLEMEDWIKNNKISEKAIQQMDLRIYQEEFTKTI